MHFQLGYPVERISFKFGDLGGNTNLSVNGMVENVPDLVDLDGNVIGGVQVAVATAPPGDDRRGTVVLEGDITDFSVGGQEFWVDDVCSTGLEPAPCAGATSDVTTGTT
ncbi:MAG: hypothetical protein GTO05_19200, partial [Gemmatimonadales bacterium]|nr:hypothetical protein [Gemmatimonadales bacterium]